MEESVWQEIGISAQHVCETAVTGRYTVICDKAWLQTLEQRHKIAAFPASAHLDRRAHPSGDTLEHPWTRILLQTYRKRPLQVYPLSSTRGNTAESLLSAAGVDEFSGADGLHFGTANPLTYSQALNYVTNTNFKNLWEAAYKRYPGAHVKFCKPQHGGGGGGLTGGASCTANESHLLQPYDVVLRELIQRVFNCPLLHCKADRLNEDTALPAKVDVTTTTTSNGINDGSCHSNVLPALVAIETSAHISVLFYPPATVTSLYDCITYSPAVLNKSYNKSLFLLYQVLQLSKSLQTCGLSLGDLRLHDILLRENLWLQIVPRLEANILLQQSSAEEHTLHTTPLSDAPPLPPPPAPVQSSPVDTFEQEKSAATIGDASTITNVNAAHRPEAGDYVVNAADVDDDDDDDEASSRRTQFDLKFAYDLEQFTLREYCEMWCHGQLSNYDYLTILNNAAGRRVNNPAYHHIMPWVSDFQARNGTNWRDLTKSKYRLNKGDTHLDLMFNQASTAHPMHSTHSSHAHASHHHAAHSMHARNASDLLTQLLQQQHQVPHHVSDSLSEITYFVYMARRTPQHILRQHVRPIWVPAEYPVSIQRLQQWSPDECIPEFYADPQIFKSIHEDLPDLELPAWATCPEDFICKHREALESQYVSERLQHWIDLNFGYKLSGKAAIKAKNISLSAADQHKHLCQRGVVQLFTQPHPPKRFPLPWFGRAAPRLSHLIGMRSPPKNRHKSHTAGTAASSSGNNNNNQLESLRSMQAMARSNEHLNVATPTNAVVSIPASASPTAATTTELESLCSTPTRSANAGNSPRLSLRQFVSCGGNGNDELPTNASCFYPSTNFIELPKDYNPSALLQSLETQQGFLARTFPGQKTSGNAQEKMMQNDLLFDRDESTGDEHSFTNQLFALPQAQAALKRKANKNLLAPCANDLKRRNLKHLLAERRDRELQVIGCLMVELFAMQRVRPLLANSVHATFEQRLNACRTIAKQHLADIPKCLRYVLRLLLLPQQNGTTNAGGGGGSDGTDATANCVTDKGLPPLTAAQLLEPVFANLLIPFPQHYYATYALIRTLHNFELNSRMLALQLHFHCNGSGGGQECARYAELDRQRVLCERKIAECKVMACAAHLGQRLLEPVAYEQFGAVELLLPHINELLSGPADQTAILAAWNLFDPLAQALGVLATQRHLLLPIMRLYDVENFYERHQHANGGSGNGGGNGGGTVIAPEGANCQMRFSSSSSFKSRKSVKLYHHSFLLRLIVRFGLACFLQHFITALIEAVGGFKEPEHGNGYHYHSGSCGDGGAGGGGSAVTRRSSKNLTLSNAIDPEEEEESEQQQQQQQQQLLTALQNASLEEKAEPLEGVFSFDDDVASDHASSCNVAVLAEAERKSNDSFDMQAGGGSVGGGGSSVGGGSNASAATNAAEEANEYETTPEKLAISEIMYGATKLSNASIDEPAATSDSPSKITPLKSPTIPIPESALRRSFEVNTIDCDFGSKRSFDSFDSSSVQMPAPAPPIKTQQPAAADVATATSGTPAATTTTSEVDDDAATDDSLQASTLSRMSEARRVPNDRISEMSAESLIWLSHRLGPVLTSRYIARNLLKLLSLCYVGQENLLPEPDVATLATTSAAAASSDDNNIDLNYFTVADARVVGDRSAARVLECLMSITALYGEAVILLQYFPHMSELVAQSTRRLTSSLEGAIIATLQLLKYLIPCLTDATLMDRLQDLILDSILLPLLRLLASTRCRMPSGYLGRSVLARKLIDAIYVLCVRIGPDMSKELLCGPLLRPFFLIFDKAYVDGSNGGVGGVSGAASIDTFMNSSDKISPPNVATANTTADAKSGQATVRQRATEELHDVFGPALAHSCYLAFLRFLGDAIMQRTLANREFILTMCHEFEEPNYMSTTTTMPAATHASRASSSAVDCPLPTKSSGSSRSNLSALDVSDEGGLANSFGTQVIGNRIEVANTVGLTPNVGVNDGIHIATNKLPHQQQQQQQQRTQEVRICHQTDVTVVGSMDVLNMVAYKFEHMPQTRHLRGNWLAYWRHEISRPEKDTTLNLQQIRLQSFVGHTNSVRAIIALDNENSFISASKDKTVKLWSLRSEGDGTKTTPCQFTYTAHRKAVHSLAFLESLRLVASCDSGVHIWDPFIGRPLVTLDAGGQTYGNLNAASASASTSTSAAMGQRHHHNPVTVVKCLPTPSPLIIAGTAESSVRIIDARSMQYVNEWRVATPAIGGGGVAATVRCLAVAPSGNWLAAGLSSGSIVQLDTRTGMVLNMWRPMECDLLQLAAPNDQQLVSSALDHSLAVWHASDSILHYQLKPPPEPAHFLQTIGQELIYATTGNRIGVYSDLASSHAQHHTVTKLRSENFRGVLTSLAVLPLNRSLLAGNESGNIALLC